MYERRAPVLRRRSRPCSSDPLASTWRCSARGRSWAVKRAKSHRRAARLPCDLALRRRSDGATPDALPVLRLAAWRSGPSRSSASRAFLRGAGVEARIEEFRGGTPTARGGRGRRRLRPRADRQVARLRLRRARTCSRSCRATGARTRRRSRRPPARAKARVAAAEQVERGDRLRARRRRAVPAAARSTRVLVDRQLLGARPSSGSAPGSPRHMAALAPARPRPARARARPVDRGRQPDRTRGNIRVPAATEELRCRRPRRSG